MQVPQWRQWWVRSGLMILQCAHHRGADDTDGVGLGTREVLAFGVIEDGWASVCAGAGAMGCTVSTAGAGGGADEGYMAIACEARPPNDMRSAEPPENVMGNSWPAGTAGGGGRGMGCWPWNRSGSSLGLDGMSCMPLPRCQVASDIGAPCGCGK